MRVRAEARVLCVGVVLRCTLSHSPPRPLSLSLSLSIALSLSLFPPPLSLQYAQAHAHSATADAKRGIGHAGVRRGRARELQDSQHALRKQWSVLPEPRARVGAEGALRGDQADKCDHVGVSRLYSECGKAGG